MRIVLDTNILVRAAADEQGLAGRLLQEIIPGHHILVVSRYILSEIARVLAYPRLQARWQLNEKTIMEFVSRAGDVGGIVLTTTPDRVVIADPDDDPIVQTAVLGGARLSLYSRRPLAPSGGCRVLRRPRDRDRERH